MKLICECSFGDSDEKCDESVWYILGLDSMDTMVVGFKEIEKVYTFAASLPKVSVDRTNYLHADKLG